MQNEEHIALTKNQTEYLSEIDILIDELDANV
jgi:hypothetical protein